MMVASQAQEEHMEGREMLTVPQVAGYMQVHVETVRRWLREGQLRGVNLGGKGGWRIRRDELERFIEELEKGDLPE
jgi:excisionase family DNA binding protein